MPGQEGVNGAASTTAGVNQGGSLTADEKLAKVSADNERLRKALSALQSEHSEFKEEVQKYREIEKNRELTAAEERKKAAAQQGARETGDEMESLQSKPENKAFFKWLANELKKATDAGRTSGSMDALSELGLTYLEEMAEELSTTKVGDNVPDEFKNLDGEKLWKLIKPHVGQFEKMNPYLKVKKAYKAWKTQQDYLKEKDELAREKSKQTSSRENGTRQAREFSSVKDALDAGDRKGAREKLGIMHGPR